jgi:hypothetical protein
MYFREHDGLSSRAWAHDGHDGVQVLTNIIGLLAAHDTFTLVVASQTGIKPINNTTHAYESD